MCQDIIGYSHKGIFLNKELTVFHNDGQAINVGVNDKADIGLTLPHEITDSGQVLRNGFGCVAKVTSRIAE